MSEEVKPTSAPKLKSFRFNGTETTITSWLVMAESKEEAQTLFDEDIHAHDDRGMGDPNPEKGIYDEATEIDDSYVDISSVEEIDDEGNIVEVQK